jgi:predicted dithiol-disulfide oxidoreductase (DUF899 family)
MQTAERKPVAELAALRHPIFPGESPEYSDARRKLLEAEINARRVLTDLAEARRQLPAGPIVSKDYRSSIWMAKTWGCWTSSTAKTL